MQFFEIYTNEYLRNFQYLSDKKETLYNISVFLQY